jgi:hypothetical protein
MMYPFTRTLSVLLFLSISANIAFAQKNVTSQELLWTRYFVTVPITENLKLTQEVDNRIYFEAQREHQFVLRTRAEYKLPKNWAAGAGISRFAQMLPHDPNISEYTVQREHRLQVELLHKQSLSPRFSLNHRYLYEWRFFEQTAGGFDYGNGRFRYSLEARYDFTDRWAVKVYDEILLNTGVLNHFDQNRIGASFQYQITKPLALEFGYFNWYQQLASGTNFFNRHIVRFTLRHQLDFRAKK